MDNWYWPCPSWIRVCRGKKKGTHDSEIEASGFGGSWIIAADKLHNLRSIRYELEKNGEEVWNRFNRGKEKQRWYYTKMMEVLSEKKEQSPLIRELEEEVRKVFGDELVQRE